MRYLQHGGMMRHAAEILDEQLERLQDGGSPAVGWYLCRCEDGYLAWFYRLDADGNEVPVVVGPVINTSDTAEEAAVAATF